MRLTGRRPERQSVCCTGLSSLFGRFGLASVVGCSRARDLALLDRIQQDALGVLVAVLVHLLAALLAQSERQPADIVCLLFD